jgi:hypothetical protein
VIPLADAIGWLLRAGYSEIHFLPTDRHPTWIQVMYPDPIIPDKKVLLGSIAVTDNKVAVFYLPLREEPPPWTPAEILALFQIIPPTSTQSDVVGSA